MIQFEGLTKFWSQYETFSFQLADNVQFQQIAFRDYYGNIFVFMKDQYSNLRLYDCSKIILAVEIENFKIVNFIHLYNGEQVFPLTDEQHKDVVEKELLDYDVEVYDLQQYQTVVQSTIYVEKRAEK